MKAITQQLKRFADDERAVSPVVGFVLIFALIMIVFTIYQAEVVPAQNAEVEFKHSQAVDGEISQLNDAIQQTGANGVPQSATIATGVQYPDRALAINPGAPAGTLETSDTPQTVTISGLSDGSGYWSSGQTFETHSVSYHSNYNILQQETTYTLENGMFVKDFENGNTLLASDSSLISNGGKQINLVLVGGEYQESSVTSSVTATPVSTSTEYHQLESNGGTIKVPTSLSQDVWQNEIIDGAAGIQSVTVSGGIATLNLKNQEYELRLTKVSLGTSSEPSATYLKSEDPSDPSVTIDATVGKVETFTVSVRDEFGNAYSSDGVTVTATTPDGTTSEVGLNGEGRATFTYEPSEEDAGKIVEVKFSMNGGDEDYETVTYELAVTDEADTDSSDATSGGIDNGYPIDIILKKVAAPDKNTIKLTFNNTRPGDVEAREMRVNGVLRKGATGVISNLTVEDPEADTTVMINGNLESLNSSFPIPEAEGGNEEIMTLTTADGEKFNQGGFLILYIVWETEEGPISDTYFVGVPS